MIILRKKTNIIGEEYFVILGKDRTELCDIRGKVILKENGFKPFGSAYLFEKEGIVFRHNRFINRWVCDDAQIKSNNLFKVI